MLVATFPPRRRTKDMTKIIDFEEKRREAMAAAAGDLDPVLELLEMANRARGAELDAIAAGRFARAKALNGRIRSALELALGFVEFGN